MSCLCEHEMLNSLCTVSLQAVLALWWHWLLTVLFFHVIKSIWCSFFSYAGADGGDQWPLLPELQWLRRRKRAASVSVARPRASPFPLGVCSTLSRLSPSEQRLHGTASVSRASLAQCCLLFSPYWWFKLIRVFCEPWCHVKTRVVLVLFSVCFSYKNGSTCFPIENHSRAAEMAEHVKLNTQGSFLGMEGERRELIPVVNLWLLRVLTLPIQTSKQTREVHNSFRDSIDCTMSYKTFLLKISKSWVLKYWPIKFVFLANEKWRTLLHQTWKLGELFRTEWLKVVSLLVMGQWLNKSRDVI